MITIQAEYLVQLRPPKNVVYDDIAIGQFVEGHQPLPLFYPPIF